eukprot:TRINITY_DN25922_c0_g1_i1.p1 TRINITY_DN25922_c0_g1~~TRINITY_DN25922_c0_g1_i1.p1  ORF type:complete len:217 (+),score=56.50 TRINITY_DN25922_c0_g1_i1:45-695(+)
MEGMEGYLLKRGAQDHRRWCTLRGWSLTWWSAGPEEPGKKPEVLGVLDLRGARFLTTENLKLTFKIEGGVPLNSSKTGKDYIMTSDNEEEFRRWKMAIERAAECDKNDKITQKGYLMKDSGKGKGILSRGGTEKRWFELKGHIMTYSETEGGKPIGQLDLRGAKVDCRADSLAFTLEGPILNVQKKGKAYDLAALTFEEMRMWTECLKRACESQGI